MIYVLIVEDDPMVADLNKRYIEMSEGFSLVGIASGIEKAWEIIENEKVDLILLDIYMPGKSGIELLKRIRRKDLAVDVMMISAASESDTISKVLRHGAVDYLIKPFTFDRFQHALQMYNKRMNQTKQSDVLNQQELDHLMQNASVHIEKPSLPKGLTRSTLQVVWKAIKNRGDATFSTEDIANDTNISQVSIRKYLKLLEDSEVLTVNMVYGSVGRPVFRYTCSIRADELIEPFL